tara:strand:- start:1406 stop:1957 length:552 start_codon:yes stop_codon:yes gene_type:complete
MNKETIENFNIVLSKIEKFSEFSPGVILFKIIKPNEKIKQEVTEFNKIVENVFTFGINEDFFIENGEYPWCSLTKKGKLAKKKGGYLEYEKYINEKELKSENKSITVNGVYIENNENSKNQSFENIANKKQVSAEPNNKPEQKSRLKKILSDPWFIGISLALLAAVLNAERIKKWLDSIIDGL